MADWGNHTSQFGTGGDGDGGFANGFGGDGDGGFANGFGGNGDAFAGSGNAGAGDSGGHGSGACFNCGKDGHNKADCPEPRVLRCRHCNEDGHTIRRCTKPDCPPQEPVEFTGECRVCGQEGHRAADCPDRPPMVCNNCHEEGHAVVDCKNPRKLNRDGLRDITADEAWGQIVAAVKERDLDDVKLAIQQYVKAQPLATYMELESAFRGQDIEVYIIAIEKPAMLGALTNMDLQGNLNKKYQITYRFDHRAARPREAAFWPKDSAENMERLKDAGEPVSRGLSKCSNCSEYGHISKSCPQDKVEKEQVEVRCFNCDEVGHRVRDCPTPRVDKFACKNCGQSGHRVADCPEPRKAGDDVECRKCGETGHYSRDCPQGGGGGGSRGCHNCGQEGHRASDCTEPKKIICRNCDAEGHTSRDCPEEKDMSKVQCRNCDEFGHESRGCPKPRDYSRIKCTNCGEMGHTKIRCKNSTVDADAAMGDDASAAPNLGGDGFGAAFSTPAENTWSTTGGGGDDGKW